MGARRVCLVLLLLLTPAGAWAELHDKDLSAGVTAASQSFLGGGYLSGAKTLGDERWSVPLDLSYHSGSHKGANLTQFTYLLGVRYTRGLGSRSGKDYAEGRGVCLFVQLLFGGLTTWDEAPTRTKFAVGAGVGLERLFSKYGGVRVATDFMKSKDSFPRFSVGLFYRFE